MYRNSQILNQKGFKKVASVYDSLATPNRKTAEFDGVEENVSADITSTLDKMANFEVEDSIPKEAAFSNGIQMFSNVRRVIADKLGVSEGVAHDLSSGVITKAEKISAEYGGDQMRIADGIVDEMKGQMIENPDILNGGMDLHPIGTHNKTLQDKIKQRLSSEMGMSHRDSELYKTLVLKQAQDMTTMLRPHKRDEIGMAIIDVLVEHRDVTAIYDLKDTPVLMQSIKAKLEV